MQKNSESPKRTSTTTKWHTTVTTTNFSKHMMEQRENADLHLDLLHTQAENEHQKNLLIGLDLKL
jgi:hypothetical protein